MLCAICKEKKEKFAFSASQMKKGESRKCKSCIETLTGGTISQSQNVRRVTIVEHKVQFYVKRVKELENELKKEDEKHAKSFADYRISGVV